jgi:glutamate carboxypeptidase
MEGLTATEQHVVERAASEPMLDQVLAWCAINSGSTNLEGLGEMARLLLEAFSSLPGESSLLEPASVLTVDPTGSVLPQVQGRNLHLIVRPEAPLQLLFTGHMDTVYAADHPFQAVRWLDAATLNGPGVADMKGGIAVMLAALKALETSDLAQRIGYEVLINSDEEVGSPGSAALIADAAQGKRAALTYEPSALPDGTLAGARPGSGNFSFLIRGRSAHAGRNPDDGRNAIVAAAELALRLSMSKTPGLSINPARIDGGAPNNVVPDLAILRVNMRPRTGDDQEIGQRLIARAVEETARQHEVYIEVHGGFARPPKPMTGEAEVLFQIVRKAGSDLGQKIAWQASGGVCDGNNIAACGVPVVDTMGVRGGKIHSEEEYLIVESLKERAALSALTIARLAREIP